MIQGAPSYCDKRGLRAATGKTGIFTEEQVRFSEIVDSCTLDLVSNKNMTLFQRQVERAITMFFSVESMDKWRITSVSGKKVLDKRKLGLSIYSFLRGIWIRGIVFERFQIDIVFWKFKSVSEEKYSVSVSKRKLSSSVCPSSLQIERQTLTAKNTGNSLKNRKTLLSSFPWTSLNDV